MYCPVHCLCPVQVPNFQDLLKKLHLNELLSPGLSLHSGTEQLRDISGGGSETAGEGTAQHCAIIYSIVNCIVL